MKFTKTRISLVLKTILVFIFFGLIGCSKQGGSQVYGIFSTSREGVVIPNRCFYYFICATSQTAENMLKSLKIRIKNSLEKELKNASLEQNKITIIRIQKLLS